LRQTLFCTSNRLELFGAEDGSVEHFRLSAVLKKGLWSPKEGLVPYTRYIPAGAAGEHCQLHQLSLHCTCPADRGLKGSHTGKNTTTHARF